MGSKLTIQHWCNYCKCRHPFVYDHTRWQPLRRIDGDVVACKFHYGVYERKSRFQLDIWEDMLGHKTPIASMSDTQLERAIKQIEDGWRVFGQRGKLYTLKKELARRQDV